MVDPVSILTGIGAAADVGHLVGVARAWLDGDELDRLLDRLDRVFGEKTGLSAAQLETWKDDEGFCAAVFAISYTGDWEAYRASLRQEVLRLTAEDASNPRPDEAKLVDEVVGELEHSMSYAKQGDEVTRYVGHQTALAAQRATVQFWTNDWAPEPAKDLLDQLAKQHSSEAAHLKEALQDKDAKTELAGLLRVPPSWLSEGSGLLWEVLAASAEGVGLWSEAVEAWDEAFDRAGSDRARTRVRATTAAHISGDPERGRTCLAQAEEVDPTHPLVLFAKAQQSDDPEFTFELLASIEPRTEAQSIIRDARQAVVLAELDRWPEAEESLAKARESAHLPKLELREVEADIRLLRNRSAWLQGSKPNTADLREAAELYLEIRDKHRDVDAYEGSVAYLSKAVDGLIMADDRRRVVELLDLEKLRSEELEIPNTRPMLAEQLLKVGRSDLASEMLEGADADDEPSQLIRALARVQRAGKDDDSLGEVVEFLDRIIVEGEHRVPAAQGRMVATMRGLAEWSEDAFEVLAAHDRGLAAVFRAHWLASQERWDEAERALQSHIAEPRAQHALLEIARERNEPDRIAVRAREILSRDSDFAVRLEAAIALSRVEAHAEAEDEFESLCSATEAPLDVRLAAFPELAELLQEDQRYQELLKLTDAWLQLDPQSTNAGWGRAHCLFRLGRFEDGLALIEDRELEPRNLGQMQLLGRLRGLVLKGEEAVRGIVELADALDEPDEALEALALFSALDTGQGLPRDLLDRVNPDRFLEQFPETTLVQKVKAPKTVEEFTALLQEVSGDREQRIGRASEAVFEQVESPVALIALAVGRPVSDVWRGLDRRPISLGIADLAEDERANAANAMSLGAVWDPSSLYFAEALGDPLKEKLLELLPKSVVPQSVLDDLLEDAGSLQASDREQMTIRLDDEGLPLATTWSADEVRAQSELADGMRELARSMGVEPDTLADDHGAEASIIREKDIPPQMITFVGVLAVARRLGLPVFSADRFARLRARQVGLRAFGIDGIIDALADSGSLDARERGDLRRTLRELGAMGIRSTAEELVSDARLADFRLTASVGRAIQDATPLRADAAEWYRVLIDFLRAVWQEAPAALDVWSARVIDALHRSASHHPCSQHASRLLVIAWNPVIQDDPFLKALASSLKEAGKYLGDRENPIVIAARSLDGIMRPHFGLPYRVNLMGRFADQMPAPDSLHVRFVPLGQQAPEL